MDKPNLIPANSVTFEYVYVANQRCECGGLYNVKSQELVNASSSNAVDRLSAQCGKCNAGRQFDFDISSFFGQFDAYDSFKQVDVHFREAMGHIRAADFAKAEALLRQVIDPSVGEPAFAWAHFHLGMVLLMQSHIAKAIEHLERALAIQPLEPDIHEGLGRAYQEAGKEKQATKHFQECEKLKIPFEGPKK
jgi:tetratricopeptide (TPR) repeat protein